MADKFRTKTGRLTLYSFACGYVEAKHYGDILIELYQDGCFHVRAYDLKKKERRFWESFDTLTNARRHYDHAEALLVAKPQ